MTSEKTKLPSSVDIVVIGGGIIGLSFAYEAAAAGRSVLVVERRRCGSGATPVAAGMLAPISEAEATLPGMVEFGLESSRLYPDFVGRIEADSNMKCGYRTEGTLSIAVDRDQMEQLEHRAATHKELGLKADRLSAREVQQLEPGLSTRILGGLRTKIDCQVDPRALSAALVIAGSTRGVVFADATEVASVELGPTGLVCGVSLTSNKESMGTDLEQNRIKTQNLVLCAGAWTRELIPEVSDLPLYPVKGQVIRLRGDVGISHVVTSPDAYLVPRADGELVVGASTEDQGFDDRPTAGVTMELLGQAWRILPSVYELEIAEINVGFRPAFPDHMPAIGPIGLPGAFVATGHYRNGILLAPATAKYLYEIMDTGRIPEVIERFTPARFGGAHPPAVGGTMEIGT